MGIFGNLTNDGLEEAQDRLGGYQPLETDAYDAVIKVLYAGQSQGGAHSVTGLFELPGGKEYRETFWITNKKGENFFLNKNDTSKKVPLPGFTVVDDICFATSEKPLSEQATEDKVVNIYDPEAKKELPKSVPVLVDLIGKTVTLGIVKQTENVNEKNASGDYVPTDKLKDVNTVEKVFHTPTKMTMVEARQGATEATFYNTWVERNKGVTRDRRALKDGAAGKAGRPGASGPPKAGATDAPARKSLFGN